MKSTKIKVADLLRESGRQDTIQIEHIVIDIPGLTDDGVQGNVHLTSFNNDTIEANFTDISCERNSQCDKCSKSFVRSIRCDFYETIFTKNQSAFEDKAEDELFPIDDKDNIDISQAISQAIILQDPVTILCYDCINQEPDEEEETYFESSNSITFH